MAITKEQLIKEFKALGIKKGEMLHLKVSMKSIGNIEGGGNAFLEALLEVVGDEGTLVSDAFINSYPFPLSRENAKIIPDDDSKSYAGYFSNLMIKYPKSYRSKHPIHKFSAIGKDAKALTENHTPNSGGYDLLDKMCEMGATNLTIGKRTVGVGTTHIAIEKMNFKKKIVEQGINFRDEQGNIKQFKVNWNGGCGNGFPKFIEEYRKYGSVIKETKIGEANALYTKMSKTLEIEMNILRENPNYFFCDNPACYDCRISWEHSDKEYLKFYFAWIKSNYKTLNVKRMVNILKLVSKKRKH